MKKKVYLIIIILILIFMILSFCKLKNNIYNDIMIFDLWSDIRISEKQENEYIINPKKQNNITIDVFKTVQNGIKTETTSRVSGTEISSAEIYEKVAPGSYGNFAIKIEKPLNQKCNIKVKDLNNKPKNLVFIIDGQRYESIQKIQEKLNQIFQVKNIVIINWEWKYDFNQEKDIEDTQDGKNISNYKFEIFATIE